MLINPDFNHFLKVREDDTFDILGHFEGFIQEPSQVELYDTPNLTGILQAYKKDPKSVIGICKKIVNNKSAKKNCLTYKPIRQNKANCHV